LNSCIEGHKSKNNLSGSKSWKVSSRFLRIIVPRFKKAGMSHGEGGRKREEGETIKGRGERGVKRVDGFFGGSRMREMKRPR
jgi:hypothetical protein